MAGYEQEGAQRGGHIPGAASVPWAQAVKEDGTFKSADDLRELYTGKGVINGGTPIIAYCRIGERSAHTWFVLHELLGQDDVKNYDGSWTEWGNMVGLPVEKDVDLTGARRGRALVTSRRMGRGARALSAAVATLAVAAASAQAQDPKYALVHGCYQLQRGEWAGRGRRAVSHAGHGPGQVHALRQGRQLPRPGRQDDRRARPGCRLRGRRPDARRLHAHRPERQAGRHVHVRAGATAARSSPRPS